MPDNKISNATTNKKDRKYVTIMGIKVDSTQHNHLLSEIQEKLAKNDKFYIVTPNPEIILQARTNPALTHSLNSAAFSVPDGEGLKLANKNLHIIKGRELMLNLLQLADLKGRKVYFLGSTNKVVLETINKTKLDYKNINVKGNAGPALDKDANPVSRSDVNLQIDIVKEINIFKPDFLFLAFGAPKQEIWINKHIKSLNIKLALVVGGALDYYSGFVKPVPVLFESLKIEWLWRLFQEPNRFKRIFNATVVFPLKVITSSFGIKH